MAYTGTQEEIEKMYKEMLGSQKTAAQAQIDAGVGQYTQQKNKIPQSYDPLRNEAHVNDQMAQRVQRERMANMGMSAAGGKSMTLQNQREMGLQNNLGNISRQQKNAEDEIENSIAKLKAEGNLNMANLDAANSQQMNEALMNKYNQDREYNTQQAQFSEQQRQYNESQELQKNQLTEQQRQYEAQQAAAKQAETFNQAWALYQRKKMSSKMFEKMTGMKLK